MYSQISCLMTDLETSHFSVKKKKKKKEFWRAHNVTPKKAEMKLNIK